MPSNRDRSTAEERAQRLASMPLILRCATLQPDSEGEEESVEDRQNRVPGFCQEALSKLTVLVVGAGALGGEIAEGLVRKGVGTLKLLDFDTVDASNLNRQKFLISDVHQPKAFALARNLEPHGALGTRIMAWDLAFENAQAAGVDLSCNAIVSAVDDAQTRVAIARFAVEQRIPATFGGASVEADYANLFVQEVDGACYACAFPEEVAGTRTPCPGSPAIKDLFMQLGGLAVYAIDTLFMERRRTWNLYGLSPADGNVTASGRVEKRSECAVCGVAVPP